MAAKALLRPLTFATFPSRFCPACGLPSSQQQRYSTRATPSPSVRRAQRTSTSPPPSRRAVVGPLPPLRFLSAARKAGALDADPQDVLAFLAAYAPLEQNPSPKEVEKLCKAHNIPISALTAISQLILRSSPSPSSLSRNLPQRLLYSASALRDPAATIHLVTQGLRSPSSTSILSSKDLAGPLSHLSELASQKPLLYPRAALLQGQVLSKRPGAQAQERARAMFQLVIDVPHDAATEHAATLAAAHTALALLSLNTSSGTPPPAVALSSLEHAALNLDDPIAHYHLARLLPRPSRTSRTEESNKRKNYLLKAASSGVLEAAGELSMVYSQDGAGEEARMMAREWAELAAEVEGGGGGGGNAAREGRRA